ncbi:MAG: alpha/beta hydrolase [Candidatus Saccharibacteria bacterium]|nr:alpha/beta hydrolase [Candidatus Saccharibacteria bacterium]
MKRFVFKKWYFIIFAVTFVAACVLGIVIAYNVYPPIHYQIKSRFTERDTSKLTTFYDDVQYCNDKNLRRQFDLYVPKDQRFGKSPLVVYVHGGGWSEGDRNNTIQKLYTPELAAWGIGIATIDYRLSGEAPYPAQNDDIHCAMKYLVDNSKKYGYDKTKIVIMGDSAGGHLAAMEALRKTDEVEFKGVIMLYGVSDLWNQIENYADKNAVKYLGDRAKETADKNSPLYANLSEAPPFLIVHGTNDTIVPSSESQAFYDKLRSKGISATYIPVAGASHAFIGSDSFHEQLVRDRIMQFASTEVYR